MIYRILNLIELLEHVLELLSLRRLISLDTLHKLLLSVLIVPHISAGLGANLTYKRHVSRNAVSENVVVLIQIGHLVLDVVHLLVVCNGHLNSRLQLLLGSL